MHLGTYAYRMDVLEALTRTSSGKTRHCRILRATCLGLNQVLAFTSLKWKVKALELISPKMQNGCVHLSAIRRHLEGFFKAVYCN